MPSPPPSTPSKQWQLFLSRCLTTRLPTDTFSRLLSVLHTRFPLSSSRICDLFLRPTDYNDVSLDPRIPRYLQVMLGEGMVSVKDILGALLEYSSFGNADAGGSADSNCKSRNGGGKQIGDEAKGRWQSSYIVEESMLYRLAKYISSNMAPRSSQEAVGLVLVVVRWMETIAKVLGQATGNELLGIAGGSNIGGTEEINAVAMALGTLTVSVVENATVLGSLGRKGGRLREIRKSLSQTLATFVPFLSHNSPQIAARLELFLTQTLAVLEPVDKKVQAANAELNDIIDESMGLGIESIVVADMPVMNSRAGLYVWLNSLLVARPLIDDTAIFGYLQNRYQGDVETTTIDLILASFDILANATENRNENSQTTTLLKSFLINKLPLLLGTLAASYFPPLTSEYCITEALSHVDTNAFPTLSSMFDEPSNSTNNLFSDSVRSDFCFACCLHGLIAESSIQSLLGDVPMQSLPAGGRYVKEDLVQQCLSDSARVEGLIEELENMDGNVGAVSQAITEVIGRLCSTKETMSLKTLCSHLARKQSSLDVMLLFEKPTTILQPICHLLDTWRYDEDQGEYQPVYEEFGSILLLVLSFAHRYNLSAVDLGIRSADSFVLKLINQGHLSRAMDTLTSQEQSHLDGWIRGLFDNESGGLGDELMSSCPPQDFYLLVPTLFHHIVLAYSTNHLNEEGLKGGLEFLVDTFLLPSLIPAITWLSSHLWESRGDTKAVLLILRFLIANQSSGLNHSSESSMMLGSILNVVSRSLEHSLRFVQRAEPSRQDIEPLLRALNGNLNFERRGAADHTELEIWSKTEGGGLAASVKHTISSLVQWGLNPGINIMPASYTHRQILVAIKLLGAKRVLNTIVDELKTQTEPGNGSVVLDVAVALICAPDPSSFSSDLKAVHGGQEAMDMLDTDPSAPKPLERRINLRDALKTELDNAPKLNRTDPIHAETIVRLWRRAEAQLAVQPHMDLGMQTGLMENTAEEAAVLQGALDAAMNAGDDGITGLGNEMGGMGDGMVGLGVEGDLMSGLMGATGGAGDGADLLMDDMGF